VNTLDKNNRKMNKKEINEALGRFNQLTGYSPEKGMITERKQRVVYQDFADEDEEVEFGDEGAESSEEGGDEGGNPDFDFGDEGSPEGGEEGGDFDFGGEFGDEEGGEEEVDEFGTAGEFSAADDLELEDSEEVEEIDVTSIVTKSDEAKDAAQQAVSAAQQNSEYLKSMTDTISNLSGQLEKMDAILSRVSKLERDIKTPEEKLELRSLDSYPFNLKLTDYWNDKAAENDHYNITGGETTVNGQKKQYTISKDDVDTYNEEEVQGSFNPESDEDIHVYKRVRQY
jgi:hypothetical protein